MPRASRTAASPASAAARSRILPTHVARNQLYKLVNKLSRVRKASASLLDRAVEVGPRGHGGVVILPKIDAEAALERIAQLEGELEDLTLARFVEARLHTPTEDLLSVEELADSVGLRDLLSDRR
jgi:citrate lyase beta subunit